MSIVFSAKTKGQKNYVRSIIENTIIFCTGVTGTGKTYLALSQGLKAVLQDSDFKTLVLVKPIVQASQDGIGYFKGTIQDKIEPFARPLFNEIRKHLTKRKTDEFFKTGKIEFIPLETMRGSTFENSYVLVTEAQNCTFKQIKMVLTRLGNNSKMIIEGDIGQSDLWKRPAFADWIDIVKDIDGVGVSNLGIEDIVRNKLIKQILQKSERFK